VVGSGLRVKVLRVKALKEWALASLGASKCAEPTIVKVRGEGSLKRRAAF
jgi:hypothetical protein